MSDPEPATAPTGGGGPAGSAGGKGAGFPREIDQPPVPRHRMSWLMRIYLGVAGTALAIYLLAGVFGWDRRTSVRDRVPGSVRSSPGGYRAYHFWHAGYHGGK